MKALPAIVVMGLFLLAACQPQAQVPDQSALDGIEEQDGTQGVLDEDVSDIDGDLAAAAGDPQAAVESALPPDEQAELEQAISEMSDLQNELDPSQFDVDTTV